MANRHITDRQRVLADLASQGSDRRQETNEIVNAAAAAPAWPVKIKAHVAYNVYTVHAVALGDTGSLPVEVGQSTEAVNLAESFLTAGTLSVGTYALMFRAGQQNVFHVKP